MRTEDEYLRRAKELKSSVRGNYDSSVWIQDEEVMEWLIRQAERYEELRIKWNNRVDDRNEIIQERNELVAELNALRQKEATHD